jgi:hypothetical protein
VERPPRASAGAANAAPDSPTTGARNMAKRQRPQQEPQTQAAAIVSSPAVEASGAASGMANTTASTSVSVVNATVSSAFDSPPATPSPPSAHPTLATRTGAAEAAATLREAAAMDVAPAIVAEPTSPILLRDPVIERPTSMDTVQTSKKGGYDEQRAVDLISSSSEEEQGDDQETDSAERARRRRRTEQLAAEAARKKNQQNNASPPSPDRLLLLANRLSEGTVRPHRERQSSRLPLFCYCISDSRDIFAASAQSTSRCCQRPMYLFASSPTCPC